MLGCILALSLAVPNVVFLSVDTLRADHLGCYGYVHPTSPHIDKFAAKALVFDDCICEVPLTGPSFGSMLTSLYPRMTGTTRNGLRMPEEPPSVAEAFHEAGYQTFCVQSNWTLKRKLWGMARGFDVYEDDFHDKRWGLVSPERLADDVTDIALEQLAALDPNRPFFCWVHYSDPHAPYHFHAEYAPSGSPKSPKDDRRKVVTKYDSEVAFTDDQIARFLDALPKENTCILFVADHGESLYEHNYLGHGRRIYQTNIHIPLIIAGPGIVPGRSNRPIRGVDIGPTLLALAGLEPKPGMLGVNALKDDLPSSRARVIETYGGAVPKLPGAKALMAHKRPQLQGVLLDGWKLILDEDEDPELFYLPDDPGEENNLAAANPERAATLRALIDAWDERYPRANAAEAPLSEDDREALKSLGYLD